MHALVAFILFLPFLANPKLNKMSILVKEFNEKLAKEELKKCPKIVQDYVKLLVTHRDNWKSLCAQAIGKLRQTK